MKALRGRLIAELIPEDRKTSKGGLILINRKDVTMKAKVISVGKTSRTIKGKVKKTRIKKGDTIYFKRYSPMIHKATKEGFQEGMVTIWWDDVFAREVK